MVLALFADGAVKLDEPEAGSGRHTFGTSGVVLVVIVGR